MLVASCKRFIASFTSSNSLPRVPLTRAAEPHVLGSTYKANQSVRLFSAEDDVEAEVNYINEKFAEAREEIEFAREDAETVYFNDSAEEARRAVSNVLDRWQGLLAKVSQDEQGRLQRSMGLKIEQLKAEMKELDEMHA